MKQVYRIVVLPVGLLLGVLLVAMACGGADSEATTPTQAGTGREAVPTPAVAVHVAGLYEGTYVANASEFAGKEAADWSKATTVRVEMGEFYFKPDNLTFEIGQPYKLELVNAGKVKHEFTAEEFFASVAWRKERARRLRSRSLTSPRSMSFPASRWTCTLCR